MFKYKYAEFSLDGCRNNWNMCSQFKEFIRTENQHSILQQDLDKFRLDIIA